MGKQSPVAKSQPALPKAAHHQVNSEPQNHRAVPAVVCVEAKDNPPESSHCHSSDCYRENFWVFKLKQLYIGSPIFI